MKLPLIASSPKIAGLAFIAASVVVPNLNAMMQTTYGDIQCTSATYGGQNCQACYVYTPYGWVLSGASWS
jgi:hypothetical protein